MLADTTVPAAAALIGVPFEAPISIPLWVEPHLLPKRDVTVPETGLIKLTPNAIFLPLWFVPEAYFTVPDDVFTFGFISSTFSYNFEMTSSDVTRSLGSASNFSLIVIVSLFLLFLSFNPCTACSASSKVATYNFSSSESKIA